MGTNPTAADRAVAIVTSFQLSDEDEELGEKLFEIVDDLVQAVLHATTPEDLERAQMAISNTFIMMAAIVDGVIGECPKDVQLHEIASTFTGSLA